jgi:hypothetical protein
LIKGKKVRLPSPIAFVLVGKWRTSTRLIVRSGWCRRLPNYQHRIDPGIPDLCPEYRSVYNYARHTPRDPTQMNQPCDGSHLPLNVVNDVNNNNDRARCSQNGRSLNPDYIFEYYIFEYMNTTTVNKFKKVLPGLLKCTRTTVYPLGGMVTVSFTQGCGRIFVAKSGPSLARRSCSFPTNARWSSATGMMPCSMM